MRTFSKKSILLLLFILIAASPSFAADSKAEFTLPNGILVTIIEAPFEEGTFKVEGCTGKTYTCLINGKMPFGNDLDLPKTFVKSITVTIEGKPYLLEVDNMYNAWGDRHLTKDMRYFGGDCYKMEHEKDTDICWFRGFFSDAAGSYVASWELFNGNTVRTILSKDEDIVVLISNDLDGQANKNN